MAALRFDKIIFAGSIVDRNFDWPAVLKAGQVNLVRNDYGALDRWPRMAPWLVRDSGASGSDGFLTSDAALLAPPVSPPRASGDVVVGCNIENAAYSPSVCAERVAVFSARAQDKGPIAAIAIVTASGARCTPCGTCRQVLWELARGADIVLEDGKGGYVIETLQTLLPRPFGPEDLGVDPVRTP